MRGMLRGLVVVGMLAGAAPAGASTLDATYYPYSGGCCESRTIYSYNAAAGEDNDVTVTAEPGLAFPVQGTDSFVDVGNLITRVPQPILDLPGFAPWANRAVAVLCTPTLVLVVCTNTAMHTLLYAVLGDQDDRGSAKGDILATWDGGAGRDATGGGSASDTSVAGPGADWLLGYDGYDTADYSARTSHVTITLDGLANDGDAGEGDYVAPDIERVLVGSGGSTVTGNDRAQYVIGGTGSDTFATGDGDDQISLRADGAADHVSCGGGNDDVYREGGADPLDTIDADCETVHP